ncbi:MAG: glycosyltransferase [Caldilineae bacterium]|nr:MAG: glycosyltransferase [Caldilineae bacterium]
MAHISVVIPVYKAEKCLDELIGRLQSSLEKITSDYECLLIEDGSGDGTWKKIVEHAKRDARIRGIRFSRNFGQHHGITAGLDHARGDWVVVMDCDLQDAPEEIPRLYAKAQEGHDVVLARRARRRDSTRKQLSSRVFYRLFNYLTGMKHDASVGNFRIMSAKVVRQVNAMREGLRFLPGMVEWLGFTPAYIDVEHGERYAGESTYTLARLLALATDTIIAYSDKPLRISVQIGFAIAGLAFLAGLILLIYASIYDVPIMGWSSLMVSLYFLGGIIIANLGIIGIYLGKTFDETKKRPLYVIDETTFDSP